MLLLNLTYEAIYICADNKKELQGPKHVRELSGAIASHFNTVNIGITSLTCIT